MDDGSTVKVLQPTPESSCVETDFHWNQQPIETGTVNGPFRSSRTLRMCTEILTREFQKFCLTDYS